MKLIKKITSYQNVLPAFRKQNTSSSDSGADRTVPCAIRKDPGNSVITTPAVVKIRDIRQGAGVFPPPFSNFSINLPGFRPPVERRAGAGINRKGGDMGK